MPPRPWVNNWKDYYEILQVHSSAEAEVVKAAYFKLLQKYHPDHYPDKKYADKITKKIIEAYEVLSDPIIRQEYYQEWLKHQGRTPPLPPPPPPPPPPELIVLSRLFVSPKSVQLGGSINVSVVAINKGGTIASKTIAMTGDFTGSKVITLKPSARGIAKFTITPKTIGNFNVSIDLFTGSFSVTEEEKGSYRDVLLFLLLLLLFGAVVIAPIVIFGIMHGHK